MPDFSALWIFVSAFWLFSVDSTLLTGARTSSRGTSAMEKVVFILVLVLALWFALRVARFAMKLILFLVIAVLLAVGYFLYVRR